jgi:ABC-type multidrug transport system fused ATPase/permease subunit
VTTDSKSSSPRDRSPSVIAAATARPVAAALRAELPKRTGQAYFEPIGDRLSTWQLLRWMFRFARPVIGLAIVACFWLVAWVATETMMIRQAGVTVNFINLMHFQPQSAAGGLLAWLRSGDPQSIDLIHLVRTLLVLVVVYAALRYLREVSNTKMSMNLVFYIREAIYDRLQRVGFGFHDALSSGQLINRALSDLQNVRQFVQTAILSTLEIVLVVIFDIVLIYTRNKWVAALALVPLPIWTIYILRFSKKMQPAAKAVLEAEDRNVSIIAENVAGVHVVKAFATEQREIQKYGDNCTTFKERVLKRVRILADFQPIIRSIATASHLSLFLAAGILMIKGRMQGGDLLILGGAMGAILARLQSVANINEQYQNAIVSSRRLYEVLMAPPTVPQKADAKPLPAGPGQIAFERVSFGYDRTKPVLHDISFSARGGSVVAIVGPTGAGKTTLVNLIARYYDVQRGRIVLDGVDVRDVTLASLRTQVSFVFQETYLFSDTVAANIAYGRPGITIGEIEAAARLAQAHEFIEQMPKGYQSVLRERGADLSGGQKQRLAIARAIVTNPRVLILDDATAAVDPETEDLIRRAMRFVMDGRTTFVIAHRVSTVKRADLVIVLEHGRIAQLGTHDELMEQEGHYRDVAVAQLYADDEDVPPAKREHPSHMQRAQSNVEVTSATEAARDEEAGATMGK